MHASVRRVTGLQARTLSFLGVLVKPGDGGHLRDKKNPATAGSLPLSRYSSQVVSGRRSQPSNPRAEPNSQTVAGIGMTAVIRRKPKFDAPSAGSGP